eukprot:1160440-Amphidinium_carterae.1
MRYANVLCAVVLHLGPATPWRDVAVKRRAQCSCRFLVASVSHADTSPLSALAEPSDFRILPSASGFEPAETGCLSFYRLVLRPND